MEFDENAQLDTSQINDIRSQGGSGGGTFGGTGMGGGTGPGLGAAIGAGMISKLFGGGIGGLIAVAVLFFVLNSCSHAAQPQSQGQAQQPTTGVQNLASTCVTGADANTKPDCRIVAAVNSTQAYWAKALAGSKTPYRKAPTVFFRGSVKTACGPATSAVGPFYCPGDEKVYIDLGFFDQLRRDFGANGGPFAETYVIAHEYGHHVQHIVGYDKLVGRDRSGPLSGSVRLELQADCFAGVWARNAVATGFVKSITQADIDDGLNAAAVIGDDRIMQTAGQRINPEKFTHGTSAQRQRWLTQGYTTGDPNKCDTWNTNQL